MPTTGATTPRARARAVTLERIKALARDQMGAEGAAALSLRSLAREIGVTPSAIYRYYDSRNALLNELIEEAWGSTADAMEQADAAIVPDDVSARFRAIGLALRRWALDHPVDYALLYGQPIPGYSAPESTRVAAGRGFAVLLGPFLSAARLDLLRVDPDDPPMPERFRERLRGWGSQRGVALPDRAAAEALAVWGQAVGLIGLELYGHLDTALGDGADLFDWTLDQLARQIFRG